MTTLTRTLANPVFQDGLSAQDAHDSLVMAGVKSADAIDALRHAYTAGTCRAIDRVVCVHTGYAPDAVEYHAGTATYSLTLG
jgi:hypothetical protein